MFKFSERTIENLKHNAEYLILSDPLIRALFDCVTISTRNSTQPFYGNFAAYVDIKINEAAINLFEDDDVEDLSIKELTELFRQGLIEELKDLIVAEIEY